MKTKYPLEQLVRIKQRRLDEAERVLKEKKAELDKEKEKQTKLEGERDKTYNHRADKMKQFRDELDKGTTTDKIKIMRDYIKVVEDELKQKEKKVEEARKDMVKKQHDVEKLKTHRKEWEKEMKALMEYEESIESDEIGTVMHTSKKHKR